MTMNKNRVAFLRRTPPTRDLQVTSTLVGRQAELQDIAEYLASAREEDPEQVMAVVGLARVGKSHVLRAAVVRQKELARAGEGFDVVVVVRATDAMRESRQPLRDIYDHMMKESREAAQAKLEVREHALRTPERIRGLYREAIAGRNTSIRQERGVEIVEELRSQLSFGVAPTGLVTAVGGPEFQIGIEKTERSGESRADRTVVEIPPFDERGLCDLILLPHRLLRRHKHDWSTLIVLDDFDILRRDEGGAFDPEPLLRALMDLAQEQGLCIITTAREDTFEAYDKSFMRVAEVDPFYEDRLLHELYKRHVELFWAGEDPLGSHWVEDVAGRCQGRPGVFVEFLKEAHDKLGDSAREITPAAFFRAEWDRHSARLPEVAEVVRLATLHGGRLSDEARKKLWGTTLWRYVLEDYSSERQYRVDPVALSYLREEAAREE